MKRCEYIIMYKLENRHFWFLGKRFFVDTILSPHAKKINKILDVGSGTGGMTKYIQKFGDVTGIEQNPHGLALIKKRKIKVLRGNADKLNFKDKEFDLVTVFDVLYHKNIKDESKVIKEAYRVLRPGGLILVTDSAFKFLEGPHDVATEGARRYTSKGMAKIIKNSGFRILRSSYIFISLFPFILAKRLLLGKFYKTKNSDVSEVHATINSILLYILKIEAKLLNYVDFPFGSSVLVIAQKPYAKSRRGI